MSMKNVILNSENRTPDWVTIREAVKIVNKSTSKKIKDCDIYRHALYGNIHLSIYFQSPIILRKMKYSFHKVKLRPVGKSIIHRLCMLEKNCFLNGRNLIFSTEGKYIIPSEQIIDTELTGYEYIAIQRLLASSLGLPLPITGASDINYGITITLSGDTFQVFEKVSYQERIRQQIMQLPEDIASEINEYASYLKVSKHSCNEYFPVHYLPKDACFVIRYIELDKLINTTVKNKTVLSSSTRVSTPLSRLFWLACKHNEAINPLIRQPYKLLSIFEQWASADGITDYLSGDTLKTALERGSPTSASASN